MIVEFRTIYESEDGMPVRLEAADIMTADGASYRHHRLITAEGRIAAIIIARRDGEILLVRSDRQAVGREVWELPRGMGEASDAKSTDTGLRELAEETGLRGKRERVLGRYITDSSIYPQEVAVVLCDVDGPGSPGPHDGEIIDQQWVSAGEVAALIRRGVIHDAHSLAALALWKAEEAQ